MIFIQTSRLIHLIPFISSQAATSSERVDPPEYLKIFIALGSMRPALNRRMILYKLPHTVKSLSCSLHVLKYYRKLIGIQCLIHIGKDIHEISMTEMKEKENPNPLMNEGKGS